MMLEIDDTDVTEAMERVALERASRRALIRGEHIKRLVWSLTLNGHQTTKLGSTRVVISQSASRAWAIAVIHEPSGGLTILRETFDARDDALMAASMLLADKWMADKYGDRHDIVANRTTKMSPLEQGLPADRALDVIRWA
jgi:hypothetical protein